MNPLAGGRPPSAVCLSGKARREASSTSGHRRGDKPLREVVKPKLAAFAAWRSSDTPIFEDVTPDGKRFLLNVPVVARSSVGFHAIVNWPALLGKRRD